MTRPSDRGSFGEPQRPWLDRERGQPGIWRIPKQQVPGHPVRHPK